MNRRAAYLLFLLLAATLRLPAQAVDLDRVLAAYPERVARLFAGLGLERPELRAVAAYVAADDYRGAARALLAYYRSAATFPELRRPAGAGADLAAAGRLLADTFSFQGLTGRQPRRPDGALDWTRGGPTDDAEWAYLLNRHAWFATLLDAYHRTGDERYARRLNDLLIDWILHNPCPVAEEDSPPWRTLETAIRFDTWPAVFYGLQASESFSEAARLLMLISIREQADRIRRFHWTHQNHALFQLKGLARAAACWPEFRQAGEWFDYAARHMLYEMEGQVLPDGVQNELTSLYHYHALRQFQDLADLAAVAGRELPPAFRAGLEKMYDYLAYAARPDGFSPLNNDADRNDYRPDIARAAAAFRRPDWEYIISNGRQGQPPARTSVLFPYAGQVILRSGWQADAHWSFFDGGPHGAAHRHDDKLHLSLAAYGRDLLVDGGRYWYRPDIWREYFVSSYSHNVILVDGYGHRPDIDRYDSPGHVVFETNDRYTYAQATFDAGFREVDDSVRHTRGVLYLRDRFWIVIDRLTSAAPHAVQALWHLHPDCRVAAGGARVYTDDPDAGNLLIVPAGPHAWTLDLRHGPDSLDNPDAYREWKPRRFDDFPVQGAYSDRYNEKRAASVAVYNGRLTGELTAAWLLVPFKGQNRPRAVRVQWKRKEGMVTISVRVDGRRYRVVVDLKNGQVREV